MSGRYFSHDVFKVELEKQNKAGVKLVGYWNGLYWTIPNPDNKTLVEEFDSSARFISKQVVYVPHSVFNDAANWSK